MTIAAAPDAKSRPRAIIGGLERQIPNLPTEVKYCTRCVISNQRPRIGFDAQGVCTACKFAHEKHHVIDWKTRESELEQLLDQYRRKDGSWDVLVPGSGGKDSAYVAHQLKVRYGMHPLTVTWAPFKYTDIGWQNYMSFVDAGFNNLLAWPNGKLHRKLSRLAFEELGDPFQPFQYGQMAYPFHVAIQSGIKLVFYGENGEAEYGGDTSRNHDAFNSRDNWAMHYSKGAMVTDLLELGLKHKDYISRDDFDPSDLFWYRPPTAEEFERAGIQMRWYSYYHKWVPQEHYYYTVKHTGFRPNPERSEGTYSKYASIDDRMDGFHYYLMFIKLGIGRATSDAAHEIRDGHLTREEGVALVRRYDGEFPTRHFKEFLAYLDITEAYFWEVVDYYRRPHIWQKSGQTWTLRNQVS